MEELVDNDQYVVTKRWVKAYATKRVGWTQQHARILGIGWPLAKGWLGRIVGKVITQSQRLEFERLVISRSSPDIKQIKASRTVYFRVDKTRPWMPACQVCGKTLRHPFYWTRASVKHRCICEACFLVYISTPVPAPTSHERELHQMQTHMNELRAELDHVRRENINNAYAQRSDHFYVKQPEPIRDTTRYSPAIL